MGGGTSHRYGLYDMVMIKDNHIAACNGSIKTTITRVHTYLSSIHRQDVKIEIEARTLSEIHEVMECKDKVDRIMLDNMVKVERKEGEVVVVDTSMLEEGLAVVGGELETEASGNVTIETSTRYVVIFCK